jgi:hypothetical protein
VIRVIIAATVDENEIADLLEDQDLESMMGDVVSFLQDESIDGIDWELVSSEYVDDDAE